MDRVSVIIPVYNTEEYIEQCLVSVEKQTYKNLEIIVVDDNSQDNSLEVIKKQQVKDDRIKIYRLDTQGGVGAARNLGIKKASGKYIYFLDSDDYIPKETIENLVTYIGENEVIRGRLRKTYLSSGFTVVCNGTFNIRIFDENKANLLKNQTAVNFLLSRNLIIENNLYFDENYLVYTDYLFVLNLLAKVDIIPYLDDAIYFKRVRPDPILNPSLNQYSEEIKINEFIKLFETYKGTSKDIFICEQLDIEFLNFYRDTIIKYILAGNEIDTFYQPLSQAAKLVDKHTLNDYDWFLRREFKHIIIGNIKKYKRVMNKHSLYRNFKKGIKSKRSFYRFIYENVFTKLPLNKNRVFFESFGGKGYSDNSKYIYEQLLQSKNNYKFVWSINEKQGIPGNPKQVKRLSLRYYYYLAKSKYWVTNARMPNKLKKRKGVVYLQTWHGTPLKRLASDLDNVYMPGTNVVTYKTNFYNETQKWDYLVSPNEYSSNIFKRAFWFENKLLEYGYPRNDVLYNKNNQTDITNIKRNLKIPIDKKVILYAPTWRDDEYYSVGKYQFSLKLDLEQMQKQLGNEYVVVLRMHYLIASNLDISEFDSFVYDFSSYNDISELYLISDILITDYSSVFFDYANLKRPILFYTYDLEKYKNQLRGFYLDIETEVPGPLLTTTEEIISAITDIEHVNEKYKDKYKDFYNRFCKWDDGNAAQNVIDEVF